MSPLARRALGLAVALVYATEGNFAAAVEVDTAGHVAVELDSASQMSVLRKHARTASGVKAEVMHQSQKSIKV